MIIRADARHIPLRDGCVQTVVTSPPYWGLRDYGTASWQGGDGDCEHRGSVLRTMPPGTAKQASNAGASEVRSGDCACGARRIDRQIGLEPTPDAYVETMVGVFREVRRVLRDDGTVWCNLGDSYARVPEKGGSGTFNGRNGTGEGYGDAQRIKRESQGSSDGLVGRAERAAVRSGAHGLKPKDLCGIPWLVAFALQADGWYLRSDIIWAKPNPMPESVTDRPTRSHENLFLLAKGQSRTRTIAFSDIEPERVHFGLDFGKQSPTMCDTTRLAVDLATAFFYAAQLECGFRLPPFYSQEWKQRANGSNGDLVASLPPIHRLATKAARFLDANTTAKEFLGHVHGIWRDLRDADHLLIGRALAECSDTPHILVDGNSSIAINNTGKPRKVDFLHERIIDTVPTACKYFYDADAIREAWADERNGNPGCINHGKYRDAAHQVMRNDFGGPLKAPQVSGRNKRSVWTVNSEPTPEAHFATFPQKLIEPCILAGSRPGDLVLDPFIGSGTVGKVAERFGRRWVGLELSEKYINIAKNRTAQIGLGL